MYKINAKNLSRGKSHEERFKQRAEYGGEIAGIGSYYKLDKKLQLKIQKMLNDEK